MREVKWCRWVQVPELEVDLTLQVEDSCLRVFPPCLVGRRVLNSRVEKSKSFLCLRAYMFIHRHIHIRVATHIEQAHSTRTFNKHIQQAH